MTSQLVRARCASRRCEHHTPSFTPSHAPAAWCCNSCYDRLLGELVPEVGETQQSERVGVPLGEQVVHFRVVSVIGHVVVREADASPGNRGRDPATPLSDPLV